MILPTDRTAHTTGFDGPLENPLLEWKIAQTADAPNMQDRSRLCYQLQKCNIEHH